LNAVFIPILLSYLFVLSLTGCFPPTKTEIPSIDKRRKEWEKERISTLLSSDRVKRKDIAFLLAYYLGDLAVFFEVNPELYPVYSDVSDDTKGLKEKIYIDKTLKMGWMRNFPDGRFYPIDDIKRFQLAIILYRVSESLPILEEKNTGHFEIRDVADSDYTFKAITFVINNGFLKLTDGYFFKNKSVTGYEAARCFSVFRKKLKK